LFIIQIPTIYKHHSNVQQTLALNFVFSGAVTRVIKNSEIRKHAEAAEAEFRPLDRKRGNFAFWSGPRHFVATELVAIQ
jgi:hypothetical protein